MKKIISIIMIVAMLASIAAMSVSAAGSIYYVDTFEGTELNPENWIVDGNAFYVEDGWCKGERSAVANQTEYRTEQNGTRKWREFAAQVDVAFFDYDSEGDDHGICLWWKDYQRLPGEEEYAAEDIEKGVVYSLHLNVEARQVILVRDFGETIPEPEVEETTEGETETTTAAEEVPTTETVATYDLAEDEEIVVDPSNPTINKLGMRVQGNVISGYLNGKYLFGYTSPTPLAQVNPSPIVLFNNGMMVGFDNFTVATPDYALFAADLEPAPPAVTDAPSADVPATPAETKVETVIVTDTDDSGNVVTKIDTEIVTVAPPADTNTGGTAGGTGAQTGDMVVIVLAVMVVTLGTAIVVKKVNVK